jgi:hypothetical protein
VPHRPRQTVPSGRPVAPACCGMMAGQLSGLRPLAQPPDTAAGGPR